MRTNRTHRVPRSRSNPAAVLFGVLAVLLSVSCAGRSAVSAPSASTTPDSVTLHVFHWLGSDIGRVTAAIDRRFMEENAGITIESESFQLDSYAQALERRLAVSDPLDVIAVGGPLILEQRVKPDDLLDLTAEPWVKRLTPEALAAASDGAKVYALPIGKAVIGVAYNKVLFAKLGLSVPSTWSEFVEVCRIVKEADVVPLALAHRDAWIAQLVPRAMAATGVYGQDADFDTKLVEGNISFSESSWPDLIADLFSLKASGCFNEEALLTTYDQSIEMVATGRAAMVVNGTWIAPQIKAGNRALDLGMFLLPYAVNGEQMRAPTIITPMFAVSASTRHPAEAKKYLEFLTRPDIVAMILQARGEHPVMHDGTVTLDSPAEELLMQAKTNSQDVFGSRWPIDSRVTFFYGIQDVLTGNMTVEAFLAGMDRAFESSAETPN